MQPTVCIVRGLVRQEGHLQGQLAYMLAKGRGWGVWHGEPHAVHTVEEHSLSVPFLHFHSGLCCWAI